MLHRYAFYNSQCAAVWAAFGLRLGAQLAAAVRSDMWRRLRLRSFAAEAGIAKRRRGVLLLARRATPYLVTRACQICSRW